MVAWGLNASGQASVPTAVAAAGGAIGIAAGFAHTVALLKTGTLIGWGSNAEGQLNFSSALSRVVGFSAGSVNSLVLNAENGPGPRQAKASAQVVNGFLVGISVTDGGTGYFEAPAVRVEGLGSGAFAVASVENGSVSSIHVTSAGSGYTGIVTIVIDPPPQVPRRAQAVAEIVNGFVVGINVVDGGYGFTNAPTVLLFGGGGTGATARAIVNDGVIVGIEVISSGIGYQFPPEVIIGSPFPSVRLGVRISKIAVDLQLKLGERYQLESSNNLLDWDEAGAPFVAERENMTVEFPVNEVGRYFRLLEFP